MPGALFTFFSAVSVVGERAESLPLGRCVRLYIQEEVTEMCIESDRQGGRRVLVDRMPPLPYAWPRSKFRI